MSELRCTKPVKRKSGYTERCGEKAAEYEITGSSYSCRAILCPQHLKMAVREPGLKWKMLEHA